MPKLSFDGGLCEQLKQIMPLVWDDSRAPIRLREHYKDEGLIRLIEALCPRYSLGEGWTVNRLPSAIVDDGERRFAEGQLLCVELVAL